MKTQRKRGLNKNRESLKLGRPRKRDEPRNPEKPRKLDKLSKIKEKKKKG